MPSLKTANIVLVLLVVCLLPVNGYSYGFRGHLLVGAIADRRLALTNPAVAAQVSDLLDGMTLARAANVPDDIKGWAGCNDSRRSLNRRKISDASQRINAELRAFVFANRCHPVHNEFHYTDVPVVGDDSYADAEVGTFEVDIVHMIPFAVRVLNGSEPETNPRAITKSVAVILLAHYLGDIHQPLHVGAQFFNASGQPFRPTSSNKGFADQGGGKLTLYTLMGGQLVSAGKFHGYWDGQTVENAFGGSSNTTVANKLSKNINEPADWKLDGAVETWAEQMANKILRTARTAHRLTFSQININPNKDTIISGRADETVKIEGKFYAVWAADTVKDQIHRGGWRLAALLEKALQ